MGQAVRYGEWYTGNDTDLDEQLLEYNTEQAEAAFAAGLRLVRRSRDLANYTGDKDDADFTDEEGKAAAGKRCSRLRRSTIAPGQVCHVCHKHARISNITCIFPCGAPVHWCWHVTYGRMLLSHSQQPSRLQYSTKASDVLPFCCHDYCWKSELQILPPLSLPSVSVHPVRRHCSSNVGLEHARHDFQPNVQDTAAQVAAMTAELSRLADDMLPQEEEDRANSRADGRRCRQDSQQSKDLRQRLLDSWDGKVTSAQGTN